MGWGLLRITYIRNLRVPRQAPVLDPWSFDRENIFKKILTVGGHNLAPPKLNTPFTPTLNIGGTGRGEPDTKKNWPSERFNVKSGGEGGRTLHHIKVVQDCGHPLSAEFGQSAPKKRT